MQRDTSGISMTVFSSFKTSLDTWQRAGILNREARYLALLGERLGPIALVSYDRNDRRRADESGCDAVVGRRRYVPAILYSVIAPLLHWRLMRCTSVLRTNQLRGAWTAALTSIIFRKPLVVRNGYIWSKFNLESGGGRFGPLRRAAVLRLERFALRQASIVITGSEQDRKVVTELHSIPENKVHVVPNPVDTDLFRPVNGAAKPRPGLVVTYIGRLEPQKNVGLLIEAVKGLPDVELLRIVGDGSIRADLEQLARGLPVEFTGTVPNEQLPQLLSETAIFVLPSLYEGTPKSLLEAMACGKAVVVTRAPGTQGVVTDGETGLVVDPDPTAIARAINRLNSDSSLRERLGAAARRYVRERHSMLSAADSEATLIRSVVYGQEPRVGTTGTNEVINSSGRQDTDRAA